MARKLITVSPSSSPTKKLPGNILVDARHIERITKEKLYSPAELASIFDCSEQTILRICHRLPITDKKKIDGRWIIGLSGEKFYHVIQVARILGVSAKLIYKIRGRGELDQLNSRIPGWSLIDFIKNNASPAPSAGRLDNIRVSSLVRIPGWSVIDYITYHCSAI